PELFQVIELIDHPLEVASVPAVEYTVFVEVVPQLLLPICPGVPVTRPRWDFPRFGGDDGRLKRLPRRVVRWIAVSKTFGKDLVEDGVGGPVRHPILRSDRYSLFRCGCFASNPPARCQE